MADGIPELPFVGDDRKALVDHLVGYFDEVKSDRTPRCVSLEAASGWGKTRILQEFYRRLAADRQDSGTYWPPTLLDAVPDAERADLTTPDGRRKAIYPRRVSPDTAATPAWFWWGIMCSMRAGTPAQVLADDVTQYQAHEAALQRRWKAMATRRERLGRAAKGDTARELADTGLSEGVSLAASLASVAVPGLGFGLWAAKRGIRSLRQQNGHAGSNIDPEDEDRDVLVAEIVEDISQIAGLVPVVIAIEDLHNADPSLVEVLARLLAGDGAQILVVTTTWPELIDEPKRAAHQLLARVPDRVTRWSVDPGATRLSDLDEISRRRLADVLLPDADNAVRALLAARYSTPYLLERACALPTFVRAVRDGRGIEAVNALPPTLQGLHEAAWAELPQDVKVALMVAALANPAEVSPQIGSGDSRWDPEVVQGIVAQVPWLAEAVGELHDQLATTRSSYAWVRTVDTWLRRFHEPSEQGLARSKVTAELWMKKELATIYAAAADRSRLDTDVDPIVTLQRARLLVALNAEGFIGPTDRWLEALAIVSESLADLPDEISNNLLVDLADEGLAQLDAEQLRSPHAMTVRSLHAGAVGEAGDYRKATTILTALLADQQAALGTNHPDTLTTRGDLALWQREGGNVTEATAALEELLSDQTRILGPDNPETLNTRHDIAFSLGMAGHTEEAVGALTHLLEDEIRIVGPEEPETLATRNDLAFWLGQADRPEEALNIFYGLLADQTRILGADSPATLVTRRNLATTLAATGRVDDAIAALEGLVADTTRVLGPNSPHTLLARNELAARLGDSGRVDDAITAFEALVDNQTRILGKDSPEALTSRNNLAFWQAQNGQLHTAIAAFEELLATRIRVEGRDAPHTLQTQINLAENLGEAGRAAEAVAVYTDIAAGYGRVTGANSPSVLAMRSRQAHWLAASGQVAAAMSEYHQVLDGQVQLLGPDAPDTITTRTEIAFLLANSGRTQDAITAFRELLSDLNRIRGAESDEALQCQAALNQLLGDGFGDHLL